MSLQVSGFLHLVLFIVDKAEASEALKANVAWSIGLNNPKHLLSSLQLNNFRSGETVSTSGGRCQS